MAAWIVAHIEVDGDLEPVLQVVAVHATPAGSGQAVRLNANDVALKIGDGDSFSVMDNGHARAVAVLEWHHSGELFFVTADDSRTLDLIPTLPVERRS